MNTRIMIMAGGTGGHVFPALAVAEDLRARGVEVSWLGTPNGLEADVIPKAGFPIDWISITGLRGKGILGWLGAPMRILRAISQALRIYRQRRPHAVLGMGGFATGPGGVAAWLTKTPLLVHEQNSIPGMTNKILARFACKVMEAFPDSIAGPNVSLTGNPLRQEFNDLASPEERLKKRIGPLHLLVIGGSLGAMALNESVPKALAMLTPDQRPMVRHQSGKRNIEEAKNNYVQAGVQAEIVPFIDNVVEAYEWADLVLCRAGALTISEIAAVGVASILVPFPHAVDDHQTKNAAYLVNAGAAILIPQNIMTPELLRNTLQHLVSDRAHVMEMAVNARKLAKIDATREVAEYCLEYARV